MSRGCVRPASKNYGRLLSHAEPNDAGCCANGRNKYFAIIARDSRPFDVTQSACLPRIALRAWRPRRTGGAWLAALASHALRAPRALRPSWPLRTGGALWSGGSGWAGQPLWTGCALWSGGAGWAGRPLRTGCALWPGGAGWAGRPLWTDNIPGDQALRGPAGRTLSDDP